MADLGFIRGQNGLVPDGADAAEWFDRVRPGARVVAKVTIPRNYKFHRKFFAMLNVAYGNWDGAEWVTDTGIARCSFESFREDVIKKAGHFTIEYDTGKRPRKEAKSISFAKMDEDEFARLYSSVVDVILAQFLTNWTGEDMDRAVENFILGFG